MRKSIQFKLFISIILILLITTFVGFLINSQLFKDFYLSNQRKEVLQDADLLNQYIQNNQMDLYNNTVEQFTENKGYIVYKGPLPTSPGKGNMNFRNRRLDHNFQSDLNNSDNYSSTGNLFDFSIYYNDIYSNNFLRLTYLLSDNSLLIIETSIAIVNTSARFNLQFYLIISMLTVLIGGIFSYFFSKWFTRPILELSQQAEAMINLDFSHKFKYNQKDEIGVLGENINALSLKLEKTIAELNKDLLEKEKLEGMRKTFIANISHELKTPIALIKGYSEGLLYDVNENKEDYVNIIIDETNKMDHLVKELLEVSNLESGKVSLNITSFDLSSLIDDILYRFNRLFKDKNISIKTNKKDIVMINADYKKIEEVITNYLNNAIRHCSGDKIIQVDLLESNNKIKLSVFNTGEQIPKDDLENIWSSFYKVDESRTRVDGSTGLGLYIVRKIMELHKGDFGVINKTNGIEFYFVLNKN
ncbi:MAG TPA: HAMP domain-containing sensor histidine kinase [Clostridia bacterium]|nr:HAMP domain-containing sensor histidine kinase [Clostridia bacterium]